MFWLDLKLSPEDKTQAWYQLVEKKKSHGLEGHRLWEKPDTMILLYEHS